MMDIVVMTDIPSVVIMIKDIILVKPPKVLFTGLEITQTKKTSLPTYISRKNL